MPDSSWPEPERRTPGPDRRRVARGGRRSTDVAGSWPKVVLAEGYPSARAAIRRYLEAFGFEVLEAVNGDELLGLMGSASPAVVIADTRLPGLSGNAALAGRLDRRRQDDGVPVIVTRSAPDDLVPSMEFAGSAADLAKPFNLHSMLAAIRRALRRAGQ